MSGVVKFAIPYGMQSVTEGDVESVSQALREPLITTGPKTKEFEEAIANYCVAVSNGTAALHLVSLALLNKGDEVLTTVNSFLATSNSLLYVGAKPIFVDIADDGHIDLDLCEKEIEKNPDIKAIYGVAFSGNMLKQKRLKELKYKYDLIILEDNAHAIGATQDGVRAGSCQNNDASIFSFHPSSSSSSRYRH